MKCPFCNRVLITTENAIKTLYYCNKCKYNDFHKFCYYTNDDFKDITKVFIIYNNLQLISDYENNKSEVKIWDTDRFIVYFNLDFALKINFTDLSQTFDKLNKLHYF